MARNKQAAVVVALAVLCPCAFSLNPSLDVGQYAHHTWTTRDGFFKGAVRSVAQTPDGYLWLGTDFGLLRFDGVHAVEWTQLGHERLPDSVVASLLVTQDGTLWIGTLGGVAAWNGTKLTRYPELDGRSVLSIAEDREGTVWAGSWERPPGRLCVIRTGGTECFGSDGSLGLGILSLFSDRAGNLWAGAQTGLWRWRPAPPQLYAVPHSSDRLEIRDLSSTDDGAILLSTDSGVQQLRDGTVRPYSIPGVADITSPERLLRDRDGGLWIGTANRGLVHIHRGHTDTFSTLEGLSGDFIDTLFEDREGNLWVGTSGGLDRFREFATASMTTKQGLANDTVWSVLAATDGSVWLGSRGGLDRWIDGRIANAARASAPPNNPPQSLFQDEQGGIWVFSERGLAVLEDGGFTRILGVPGGQVHSIAGDSGGNVWLAHDEGLFHLRDRRVVEHIRQSDLGNKAYLETLLADGHGRGVWIGFAFRDDGLAYFENGQIGKTYSTANGLAGGRISDLRLDGDGRLWVSAEGGLSVIKDGRVATLTSKNGLCDSVHWTVEDDNHAVWLYTPCGLLRVPRADLEALASDPNRTVLPAVFDAGDGVRLNALSASSYFPRVAKAQDGRLWFVTGVGVGIIDPRHLPFNKLPPPVHIEKIKADGEYHDAAHGLKLPALIRDVSIEYTALSLAAPEKVHFKYKLEGQDQDWTEVVNKREVQYTNLKPRKYRFHVMASNNSGVWNETGDTLEFSIAPAWNQTAWFYGGCAAAFLAMLWALYRLRLYQISREFHAQLEGRVEERLHVARELHDTLLQSFHGLLPRFQAVYNLLPGRVADAKQVLETALEDAGKAITEARDAVQGMRSSTVVTNDLPKALELFGEELAAQHTAGKGAATNGNAATFSADVEGTPQDLQPILRDEIYRIAAEALRNAFHHAQARRIEVEIRYGPRDFRVRVRDDGAGIDPAILGPGGRSGHFGLKGMRERAEHIGGKLELWSERGAGTEIELTIPGSVAYRRKGGHGSQVS